MTLLSKGPWQPAFIGRKRDVRYRARFWDSDARRHYERDCDDVLYDKNGRHTFLNTSSGVGYYAELLKAAK